MEESCETQINSDLRNSRIISTDPMIVPRLVPQNVFLEELKEKSKQKQLVRMLERRMSHDDDASSTLKKSSCKNVVVRSKSCASRSDTECFPRRTEGED